MQFAKGHGTENDFVILPDPGGQRELTAALTARLCDRRAGIVHTRQAGGLVQSPQEIQVDSGGFAYLLRGDVGSVLAHDEMAVAEG